MDNSQNPTPRNNAKWAVPVVVVILLVAIYAGVSAYNKRNNSNTNVVADSNATNTTQDINADANLNTNTATNTSTNTSTNTATNTPPVKTSTYKNGTYKANGSYISPGGQEQVAVSLTIKNDIVTDSSVTPTPASPTSSQYQGQFVANYKQFVTGKNISTLNLSKVAGSSLTSKGFNAAVEQIKAQAKA